MATEQKKGLNTNSNAYIIIYSTILVVIVAFCLAFIFQALKDRQDANVALDKKKQVLASLNIRGLGDEESDQKYKEVILSDAIIDAQGNVTAQGAQGGEKDGFKLNSGDYKQGRLALYTAKVDGQTKYIVPVYGMGLWGSIWGYVALNEDCRTIYGAFFNHEGETAGLGAEIKDSQEWQDLFKGKQITNDKGDIVIAVKKASEKPDPKCEVDAVTGATLTSVGVSDMLQESFGKYKAFLTKNAK